MPLKSNASFLEAYNSLTDKHLINYFSTSRMRRHLINNGLITENGEVIPESEYKETKIRENLKRAFLEVIAHAIVEKSLEVERLRQGKLQRDLEELCRLNKVKRLREERQQRSEEAILSKLIIKSPRSLEKLEILETHDPDKMNNQNKQQNINKKNQIKRKYSQKNKQTIMSLLPYSQSPYRKPKSSLHRSSSCSNKKVYNEQTVPSTKHSRHYNQSNERDIQEPKNNTHNVSMQMDHDTTKQTSCIVKLMYLGISRTEESKIQHTIDQQKNKKEEKNSMNNTTNNNDTNQSLSRLVTVIQQPNGGNTHTLFKGLLQPGDTFQIISKRVYGFPFSLTIYVDGTQDTRVSACCEYRHRQGARIGGKHGHFVYLSVEGSFPCFRCRALKKLKQQQQQEKMKRKQKSTTDENDGKIQHEEADEYDDGDNLKVYEDDFETEDKKINEDGDYNEIEEEKLEVVHPSGINKVDIITLNRENTLLSIHNGDFDSVSSSSTISKHNCQEASHLPSIGPEKMDNSKDQFCEAIIRQQDEELMRLVLPKPNTSDKLKLRWPLNDLKITDKIKYVDFCNLSNVLTMPLSDVEKLELCLEIPEEDIMYKFVEHSSLTKDGLITFRNPLKIFLEDEENDEMNNYSLLRFLYELDNGCNSDVENENPTGNFENIKDKYYESGESNTLTPTFEKESENQPSIMEQELNQPDKILDLERINTGENKTVEHSIENTTNTVTDENMRKRRSSSTESLENNTKRDPTITSFIHNDNVQQNVESQSSSVTSDQSMELKSSLYKKDQVVDGEFQHSLPTSSSVLPSSTISSSSSSPSSPSSPPVFTTTTFISLEKSQLSSNSSIDDISIKSTNSKETHNQSNHCIVTYNTDYDMSTKFTEPSQESDDIGLNSLSYTVI
ncbi:hypothetical protein Smp_127640 [Schistosoma mansoni]|uniref:hypothetical protein n=1 Tax=Schistosoma mansoni TaxID=6183 RepID=UPI0001A63CB9|nr:hypothetical protein Smp_127640 [Schistosoma mansoni]|eukprot:XP_018647141.1 hypothetical protein Smp_127640 [Schistosoma mansoni]